MAELNAITLRTTDMAAAIEFYELIGCTTVYGGPDTDFATMAIDDFVPGSATNFINLTVERAELGPPSFWGRYIIFVDDPDAHYDRLVAAGRTPMMAPSNAMWGERYFHILDPDGHEVSLARRFHEGERPDR
ncbi:MAG: VOC family protein [Acidimicrobiales bacterium]